ncbi:hypothetical protein CHUAL_001081 [Chamberlinius hualienensis]
MASLRVPEWSPDEVADWIKGLDDCFRPYIHSFLNNDIDGRHLMTISSDDLNHLNIWKIGHQELLMEAIEQLRQSFYHLDVENLQWLALKSSCKARSLFNELSRSPMSSFYHQHPNYYHPHYYYYHHLQSLTNDQQQTKKQEQVATGTLSAVDDLIVSVKALVNWIDRPPFSTQQNYRNKRSFLLQRSVELATNAQRDKFAEKPNELIRDICGEIDALCDELIKEKRDPMVLQPSALEIATIRKKPNEELGMHISTLFCSVNVIGSIKYQSPTSACGRVETGDEIVQVNYQTVVGWQLKKLVAAMKENSSEVILTLKKRPKHTNTFGRIFPNHFLFMSKRASPKTARPKSTLRVNDSTIGNTLPPPPVVVVPQISTIHVPVTPEPAPLPPPPPPPPQVDQLTLPVISPPEMTTEDEDDDSAFLSEADSRSLASDVHLSIPKMHVALQRRATVTGASPTATRPPVSIDQLWHNAKRDQIMRSYSHDISRTEHQLTLGKAEVKEKKPGCENTEKEVKILAVKSQSFLKDEKLNANETEQQTQTLQEVVQTPLQKEAESSPNFSYQVVIVGGVPHRQPSNAKYAKESSSTLPVLRNKRKTRGHSKRRISCKDLGEGECRGWLYRWKERKGVFRNVHRWVKQWCVLKNRCFYVYDDEESSKANCFVCLKGFNISPAPDCHKSKRFAFQIYRPGASFLFCSESQSDLSKWMNKLGLASIDYEPELQKKGDDYSRKNDRSGQDYSETEDEDEEEGGIVSSSDDQSSLVSNAQMETASISSLSSSSSYQSTTDSVESANLHQQKKDQSAKNLKSRSLDWKSYSKGLDAFPPHPPTPTIEPVKMSLAFEMNLDSTPPSPMAKSTEQQPSPKLSSKFFGSPKLIKKATPNRGAAKADGKPKIAEWYVGDHAATLPANTSFKSSEEKRILGSPRLARAIHKAFPHYKSEHQSAIENWKPFKISSIPSKPDDEPGTSTLVVEEQSKDEPAKQVLKPAMGVSMIGKQRRTSENRISASSSMSTISTTNSQATQTDNG